MTTYQVSEADLKTIRLNEQDTVSSVLHNVALILATPKGTYPHVPGTSDWTVNFWICQRRRQKSA